MKLNFTNFIPHNSYTYGHTTVVPYTETNKNNKNKYILEENNNYEKNITMKMRHSMISRIYPLSNCSSCRK
jgi:hypothetical protein